MQNFAFYNPTRLVFGKDTIEKLTDLIPPKAERMFTLWAEGKVIFGEVALLNGTELKPYGELDCHGIWFFSGKEKNAADLAKVF